MQQLIYASTPFGYSREGLAGILAVSRARNALHNITGALICRRDVYIQLLEGPVGKVETLYDRICHDDRHVSVTVLVRARIADRLFPEWSMKHDPARSWMWSPEEVRQGAIMRASARQVREIFLRLAVHGTS